MEKLSCCLIADQIKVSRKVTKRKRSTKNFLLVCNNVQRWRRSSEEENLVIGSEATLNPHTPRRGGGGWCFLTLKSEGGTESWSAAD